MSHERLELARVPSEARARVLAAAERLFLEHGFAAVTLRRLADDLGIRQASLYHHVPEGKEQLFVESVRFGVQRRRRALDAVLAEAAPTLAANLRAVVAWYRTERPVNVSRMLRTDLEQIAAERAALVRHDVNTHLFEPLHAVLVGAHDRGELRPGVDTRTATHVLVALLQGMYAEVDTESEHTPDDVVDVIIRGVGTGHGSSVSAMAAPHGRADADQGRST